MTEDAAIVVGTNGTTSKALKRLSALDKIFAATGEVTVRCGAREVTLPIQAVDLELVESLCRPFRPKPKVHVELVNGKRQIVENLVDGDYQEALTKYNRTNSYVYVLCALLCDIEDEHGKTVWSADNTVHEVETSIRTLKAMGIVDNQLVAILNAASNLTQVIEEHQVGE